MDDVGRFTVRVVRHDGGRVSHWIFTPDAMVHRPSLDVLKRYKTSTQQTYAYSLVDHLNWGHVNRKSPCSINVEDLQRYMNSIVGEADGVYGLAWRKTEQRPLGSSAAGNVATVVKAYYLHLSQLGQANPELAAALTPASPASNPARSRRLVERNPLAPKKHVRRPRFLPDELVTTLFESGALGSARDVMIVTWLHDGGLRVGGLCGLRFCDCI